MTTANPNGRVFWAGLLLILVAFAATAQEFRGSLAGQITDPNGDVVPGSEPFALTNNLYFPGDPTTITSRLGDGDGQGGKFGINRSAIDAPGLVTLTAFGIRNVPTTLDNLRNQPYSVANLGLTKNFRWGEGRRIQLRAEALNAFNHPYFGAEMGLNPGTAASPNAAFGLVTTQRNNPRDIQFGAKVVF